MHWLRDLWRLSSDRIGPKRRRSGCSLEVLPLERRGLLSTLTVSSAADQGAGTLRAALESAQNGDSIVFSTQMHRKTIRLASGPLVVASSVTIGSPGGRGVTITADGSSGDFVIAQGVQATLQSLIITGGKAAQGGGIENFGGLDLFGCTLRANQAVLGGAIYNEAIGSFTGTSLNPSTDTSGTLSVVSCMLVGNSAIAGPGQQAAGGAIESVNGNLAVASSTFRRDSATGGSSGGNGAGGAVDAIFSVVSISGSTFVKNGAFGGSAAGSGFGGAVDIQRSPSLQSAGVANQTSLIGDIFKQNRALGGLGGGNGLGGAVRVEDDLSSTGDGVFISSCQFTSNQAIGGSGSVAGDGAGGAIKLGSEIGPDTTIAMTLDGEKYIRNRALGGKGTIQGGDGQGGAVDLLANNPAPNSSRAQSSVAGIVDAVTKSRITASNSSGLGNSATGGSGGGGGEGGVFHLGFGDLATLQLEDSSYTGNSAIGGKGVNSSGIASGAAGGAILLDSGTIAFRNSVRVSNNKAMGTPKSLQGGLGGGLALRNGSFITPGSTGENITGNQAQAPDQNVFMQS